MAPMRRQPHKRRTTPKSNRSKSRSAVDTRPDRLTRIESRQLDLLSKLDELNARIEQTLVNWTAHYPTHVPRDPLHAPPRKPR